MQRMGKNIQKKPFYRRKGFIYTVLSIALILLGIASYYVYSFYNFANHISKPNEIKSADQYDWTGTDRVNIALFGVDTRGNDQHPRSDTMMILSIDPTTKKAALFSVMRDTYYKVPGYGFRKINEAHALGGPELAIDTLKKYLQIPIQYYVKTDFEGFAKIVDELGGIDMNVEKDMVHYDDGIYNINLRQGQQHLNGQQALMYVRYRSDSSDYVRTERQRKFLTTLASELKTTNSLVKLPDILKAIQGDIETNLTTSDMLKLGKLASGIDLSTLESQQLPPLHDSTGEKIALLDASRNGQSVIIPDVYETRLLVHKVLNMGDTVVKTYDDQEPMVQDGAPSKSGVTATPTTPTPPKPSTPTPEPVPEAQVDPDANPAPEGDTPEGNTSGGTDGTDENTSGNGSGTNTDGSNNTSPGSSDEPGSTDGNNTEGNPPDNSGGNQSEGTGNGETGSPAEGTIIVPLPIPPTKPTAPTS